MDIIIVGDSSEDESENLSKETDESSISSIDTDSDFERDTAEAIRRSLLDEQAEAAVDPEVSWFCMNFGII